jgi:hypothetical protein
MKQVFLIHAHKDLGQLNALVAELAEEDMPVFVNVDLKSSIDLAQVDRRARLVQKRIPIYWGDFSQVQATLHSLAEIVAAVPDFDKVSFVSAQDFPLLPNALLKRELDRSRGTELMECVRVGQSGWACQERYQYFHFPRAGRAGRLAARALARAMRLLGLRRRMVHGWQPYGGSSWWALSRDCIVHLLAQLEADPSIVRFFRTVSCSDELFFQTLVMASPFAASVVPDNFRFIAWPEGGARNPKVLDTQDFSRIAASHAHFCRKLDPAASAGLLPLLQGLRQSRLARV